MKYDFLDYADPYFSQKKYIQLYQFHIEPFSNIWPEIDGPIILPVEFKNMSERPKRNGKKDKYEVEGAEYSKKVMEMTCQHCLRVGHNKRGFQTKISLLLTSLQRYVTLILFGYYWYSGFSLPNCI